MSSSTTVADVPELTELDAVALRRWCVTGLEALTSCRQEIDDLNVYPVPDGDTGTNLQLTMVSVVEALKAAAPDMAATVAAVVRGSLLGARGNSGVILSQLLRGMGEVLSGAERCGPHELRAALTRSAASAYEAVGTPVEGTLLTVAREAAEAAARTRGNLAEVVRTAREAAATSLARTPELLAQLRDAGVVDAGGRGWCVLLEALESVVTGSTGRVMTPAAPLPPRETGQVIAREAGSEEFGYEVQYLLAGAPTEAVQRLKQQLMALGDSLVVVGGDGLHTVHVHVNDVDAAVAAGHEAGQPSRITVTRFADQLAASVPVEGRPAGRAVVAVAAGRSLTRLFEDCGARVVQGGPTANPSTGELLEAIRRTGAAEVVLLPNDGNVLGAADVAADQARAQGLQVAVVPTRSVLQGLAAASVGHPEWTFDQDVAAMSAAADATRWAAVTTAVRPATTAAGPCRAGDVLGLLEGQITVVGSEVEQVALELLDRLLDGGGELVTLLAGGDLAAGAGERLAAAVTAAHPAVEVTVLAGGQPHYPLLIGVE